MPGDDKSIYPKNYLQDVKRISEFRNEDYYYNEEFLNPYNDYLEIFSSLDYAGEQKNPIAYKTSPNYSNIRIISQLEFPNSFAAKIQITEKEFCVLAEGPKNNQDLTNLLRDLAKNKVKVLVAIGKKGENEDFYDYFNDKGCKEISLSKFFKKAANLPKELRQLKIISSFKFYHYSASDKQLDSASDNQLDDYYIMHIDWKKKDVPAFDPAEQKILALFLKYGALACYHCGAATARSPIFVALKIMFNMLGESDKLTKELLKSNFEKSLNLINSVKTIEYLKPFVLLIPGLFEEFFYVLAIISKAKQNHLSENSKAEVEKLPEDTSVFCNNSSSFFNQAIISEFETSSEKNDLLLKVGKKEKNTCIIS